MTIEKLQDELEVAIRYAETWKAECRKLRSLLARTQLVAAKALDAQKLKTQCAESPELSTKKLEIYATLVRAIEDIFESRNESKPDEDKLDEIKDILQLSLIQIELEESLADIQATGIMTR